MQKKMMLLVNPNAGKGGYQAALGEVLNVFSRHGWLPTVYFTQSRGDAPALVAQHAPEYGFILRYPEGKTDWTGVTYEPWHFRYVGRKLALELQSLNLTPEEYLHRLTEASRPAG